MPEPAHDFVIPEEDRPFVCMALMHYAKSLRKAYEDLPGVPEAGVHLSQAERRATQMAQQLNPPVRDYSIPGGYIKGLTYPREADA